MRKMICNRCGKEVDYNKPSEYEKWAELTASLPYGSGLVTMPYGFNYVPSLEMDEQDEIFNSTFNKKVDLCPECSKSLLEWFENGNDIKKTTQSLYNELQNSLNELDSDEFKFVVLDKDVYVFIHEKDDSEESPHVRVQKYSTKFNKWEDYKTLNDKEYEYYWELVRTGGLKEDLKYLLNIEDKKKKRTRTPKDSEF